MDVSVFLKWLEGVIPPAAFLLVLLVLLVLLESAYSRRTRVLAGLGFLAAEAALQTAVFIWGDSPELVFTLLPLTCYLPAIICLHALSKMRFLPTALTWLLALMCEVMLVSLRKLLIFFLAGLGGIGWAWFRAAVLLAAAAALVLVTAHLIRPPFLSCVEEVEGGWPYLLLLPVMLLALYSYFLSSTTDAVVLLLLFFASLAAFLALTRLIASLAEERRSRQSRLQMKALREEYEVLRKKLDLGRSYRHDMRHHMAALSAMLQGGDCGGAQRYIAGLQGQLTQIETEAWCRNAAVNGVLSAYLAQARDLGCALEVEVSIPEELPFEEADVCVVLANALENAVNACARQPEGMPRRLSLSAALSDQRRLTVRVENSCSQPVAFDKRGFPITPPREGHGQGLKSIAAVAEKYHGLFQCGCEDGTFTFRAVLLDAAGESRGARRHPAAYAGMSLFLCLFLLNCMPTLAQALESVPVLGSVIRVVDLRSYSLGWGDTNLSVQEPVLEGDGPAADEIKTQKEEFIRQMEEAFAWYVSRKYQGYVAGDIAYDVVRDDGALLVLRFTAALNAGGSVDVSRYVVLDKESGRVLELAGLFAPDANYIFPISREIEAQMAEQINAGTGGYFLPGGIWPDEDCFQSIDPDQDFYINESGQLVIVFEEYEVAPGSMGAPEFVIPTEVLDGLLAQPSILR